MSFYAILQQNAHTYVCMCVRLANIWGIVLFFSMQKQHLHLGNSLQRKINNCKGSSVDSSRVHQTIRERLEKEMIIYKDLPHIPTEHDPAHWWRGKTNTLPVLPLRPGFCNTI